MKIIVSLFILFLNANAQAQQPIKYYNLDSIVTVKGEISEIKVEPCYRKRDFIVIHLTDHRNDKHYKVEVSPRWFYNIDLLTGSKIEVTGAVNEIEGENIILASSILFKGELYHFRDPRGFPLWRGKRKQQRSSRMRRQGGR